MTDDRHTKYRAPDHGKECPQCRTGKLFTRMYPMENLRVPMLCCSTPECVHAEHARYEPLEGHGKFCRKCHKGKMSTRFFAAIGPHWGKRLLMCGNNQRRHQEWPLPDPNPLLCHGSNCPKCKAGKMKSHPTVLSNGNTSVLLACNKCRHIAMPENLELPTVHPEV